ncbi:hypothetical protein IOMTU157_p204 (plasmid) [Citrobacter portucalensis]|nr:hypothetical protein IOMTU157_p204 [Citrobacter portucalensis]
MSQFVLGLDIGYSNLKMAMGYKGEEARTVVMPVGAGPLELMPQQLMKRSTKTGHRVRVFPVSVF